MSFLTTALEGGIIVEPRVFRDERGFFLETYHAPRYRDGGIEEVFVQDNHSKSRRNTLRGLHAQRESPQGKLVRAVEGEIWDVAVDIRPGSPPYRQWVGVHLSAENFRQLYVPPGMAHGFCVLSDVAQVEYKCTDLYRPEDEITIAWNDPEIAVQWPIDEPLLSKRDSAAPTLAEIQDTLQPFAQELGNEASE